MPKFSQACATNFSHVGELKNFMSLEQSWKNFNIRESETRAFVHWSWAPRPSWPWLLTKLKPSASRAPSSMC